MRFIINAFSLIGLVVMLNGCTGITSLMFYPLKEIPGTPAQLGFEYQEVKHRAADGTELVSWWLPAKGEAKGSVVFLHGNAQNISFHQFNVHWLVRAGYNVFLLGYRQYGLSAGQAKLPDIFLDVHSGLDWVMANRAERPVVLFGQSMGASLAVYGLASYSAKEKIDAVVLDAAFTGYATMAAKAMSRNWLTWLLQLPAYSITRQYDPIKWIDHWGVKPLLMFHSPDDQVVPYEFGQTLFDKALEPKQWFTTHGKHTRTFLFPENQDRMLEFLASVQAKSRNNGF